MHFLCCAPLPLINMSSTHLSDHMERKMASEKLELFNLFVERMKAKNLYAVVEKFIGEYINNKIMGDLLYLSY